MNTRWINLLVVALQALAGHCHAQFQDFSNVPGTILNGDPGGTLIAFGIAPDEYPPYGAQPYQIEGLDSTSGIPGDIVFLTDPLGGDSPSNFTAVVSFFDPADVDGSKGLPATEEETFYGSDVPGGSFANLSLLPNTIYVPTPTLLNPGQPFQESFTEFGPTGGVNSGQEALYILSVYPESSPIPEPGTLAMLGVGLAGLTWVLRGRRRGGKLKGSI